MGISALALSQTFARSIQRKDEQRHPGQSAARTSLRTRSTDPGTVTQSEVYF